MRAAHSSIWNKIIMAIFIHFILCSFMSFFHSHRCCDDSETSPVLSIIVASVSFVIIILIMVVFILFCRRTKKRLKPADVIPAVSISSQSFKPFSPC